MARVLPLSRRPVDLFLVGFFSFNLLFVSYIIDFEQLVVSFEQNGTAARFVDKVGEREDYNFTYPSWPPKPFVDIIHWYQFSFDPVIVARPPWWVATIVVDAFIFGPFYMFAIPSLIHGNKKIVPFALAWSGLMFGMVFVIMWEEFFGPFKTPHAAFVAALNAPWALTPLLVFWRFSGDNKNPFGATARKRSSTNKLKAIVKNSSSPVERKRQTNSPKSTRPRSRSPAKLKQV